MTPARMTAAEVVACVARLDAAIFRFDAVFHWEPWVWRDPEVIYQRARELAHEARRLLALCDDGEVA